MEKVEEKSQESEVVSASPESSEEQNTKPEQVETVEGESGHAEETQEEISAPQVSKSGKKSAEELIEEAKELVRQSDNEVKDCMEILDEDIAAYEEERNRVVEGSLETTESLLEKIGLEPEKIEEAEVERVKFEKEDPLDPMEVKSLSSGKFGAFVLALIAGLATVIAWLYAATKELGITLIPTKVPSKEVSNEILSWIGGGITGGEGNAIAGIAILSVSVLVVMIAVYKIRVYLREIRNQRLAEKINEEAKFYCSKKEECKQEMEKVSAHIHQVIAALKTYDIFFDELNAKMRRVLHVEGDVPFDEYHPKSKEEIKRATTLISGIKELVGTPMAGEDGSLSDEGKRALERTNRILEHYRERLYQ